MCRWIYHVTKGDDDSMTTEPKRVQIPGRPRSEISDDELDAVIEAGKEANLKNIVG